MDKNDGVDELREILKFVVQSGRPARLYQEDAWTLLRSRSIRILVDKELLEKLRQLASSRGKPPIVGKYHAKQLLNALADKPKIEE